MKRYYVECVLAENGGVSSILTIMSEGKRQARKLIRVKYKTIKRIIAVHETRPFLLDNHVLRGTNEYHAILDGRKPRARKVRLLG